MDKITYIQRLIEEGEHLHQDFKFEISDSRKIARSLSAFANTDGGRLLIGVKDNGAIAGVRSDEEFYMIQAAAQLYTRPEVKFEVFQWEVSQKTVMEIRVQKGSHIPYKAPDKDGKYVAYVRVGDQNYVANIVLLQVWKRQYSFDGAYIELTDKERQLLDIISSQGGCTMSRLIKLTKIPRFQLTEILINMMLLKVIDMRFSESGVRYVLYG